VPVIKNADQLSLVGLAKTANDLADRARSKKLKPEEVQGGTFTITNPGVFGSLWGTPVIKHADQLSLVGLAKTANDLADRARNKKLKPDEAQGGTFTITNPGVFGSLWGTPVINQPQVAILGVGAVEKRPIVVPDADGNDSIAIKTMCYLAITYDHRLVDGADADRFMIEVKKTLETDPWTELEAYA